MFLSQFKQRLTDFITQRWNTDINESSQCDTYKDFKSLLNVEKYLCIFMHRHTIFLKKNICKISLL